MKELILFSAVLTSTLWFVANAWFFRTSFSSFIDPQRFVTTSSPFSGNGNAGKIDLLFDAECPVCATEVQFLKKRDVHGRIRFTDISAPSYDPKEHGNVQFEDGMRKLRAVLPDQRVVTGVEVFRQVYQALGMGWIFSATKLPIIGAAADSLYDIWAENRLRITGRGDLADLVKERAESLRNSVLVEDCEDGCDLGGDEDADEV